MIITIFNIQYLNEIRQLLPYTSKKWKWIFFSELKKKRKNKPKEQIPIEKESKKKESREKIPKFKKARYNNPLKDKAFDPTKNISGTPNINEDFLYIGVYEHTLLYHWKKFWGITMLIGLFVVVLISQELYAFTLDFLFFIISSSHLLIILTLQVIYK